MALWVQELLSLRIIDLTMAGVGEVGVYTDETKLVMY